MPTEAQLRDDALRRHIRSLLDDGTLPVMISEEILAGYGSGTQVCCGCSQTIRQTHVQYETFRPNRREPLPFHLGCHVLWQIECVNRLQT